MTTSHYNPRRHPPLEVAVDLVMLSVAQGRLDVLLVRRGAEPFESRWALPGGFVGEREGLEQAARRRLAQEAGVDPGQTHMEQLATYGAPERDPRTRVVSVAYLALARLALPPQAGSGAIDARWVPVGDAESDALELAFDHHTILRDGVERARSKFEYTPIATVLCGPEFTVAELRRTYEIMWGQELDPRNFHRKVTNAEDFIRPTGGTTTRHGGRPAQLYRAGRAVALYPPLLRDAHGESTSASQIAR
ncbi:NUDIX hydrolase [Leekyejoonella antrihumi]|uniref:NUDIX hydrolase n=1 Tax=Leekyejoonella antrihumi TaxID=1660198 RepID=A0A563DVW8_9MICO|nr:NUDIX domain-containing protein [Leekyejoonella antrihumi]TWP34418.1 NUDIX hydrolase [Leekyejoonella antrihumi]